MAVADTLSSQTMLTPYCSPNDNPFSSCERAFITATQVPVPLPCTAIASTPHTHLRQGEACRCLGAATRSKKIVFVNVKVGGRVAPSAAGHVTGLPPLYDTLSLRKGFDVCCVPIPRFPFAGSFQRATRGLTIRTLPADTSPPTSLPLAFPVLGMHIWRLPPIFFHLVSQQ